MELLRKKVLRYIREHALCAPGDTLIVAFSGGADSASLLDILAHLPGYNLQLVVAHLNHLLRGVESDADELFAKAAADRYNCPFALARVDVAALALKTGFSLEEAGREARYAFFREVAAKYAAAAVAVGHHKGDQAETVLMRLLRGAGGSGLSAMRPKCADRMIVRPLLSLRRPEIEAYLQKGGLPWREDSSNAAVRFLRNRIRHELLPYLGSFTADIEERLCRTAEALAADEEVLETAAAGAFSRTVAVTASGAEADIDALCREPLPLRKRLYRQALQAVKGDLRRISFTHLAAIDKLVFAARPNSELTLPGGIRVVRAYRSLCFTRQLEDPLPAGGELLLESPGDYPLPCGGRLRIEERAETFAAGKAAGAHILAALAGQLQFPLTVRYFRDGDRFIPMGMNSRKKLKNLFIDRKIPLHARKKVPLLVDRGEIVWVCGVQAAERMRAGAVDNGVPRLLLTYTAAVDRY
jgi:tRNA(Ile)-lysidine synthase